MERVKVLGQEAPSSGVLTDLYTVPNGTQAYISAVTICNRGSNAASFRLTVAPTGNSDAAKHAIYHDTPISPGETYIAAFAGTLSETDKIRCRGDTSNLSFSCFGSEVS